MRRPEARRVVIAVYEGVSSLDQQRTGQARLRDVAVDASESLCAGRGDSRVVQALSHRKFTFVVQGTFDAEFILVAAAWQNGQLLSADLDRLGGNGRLHDP